MQHNTENKFSIVGKSIPVKDAREKVTGSIHYGVDFEILGMVYGKILRSEYPHAIIKKIDASKAEALPGVLVWLPTRMPPIGTGTGSG